ncbi:hypothetical protein BJ170DRAFT_677371 [Xylariales sp. AK1849]|nr:hypothetical protein BJ170DRAFT_677371 [Xylariales sp. AK1849]
MSLLKKISTYTLLLLLSTSLVVSHSGQRYDYGKNVDYVFQKREVNQSAIVGSLPFNGSMPLRPEVRELEKNHEMWSLYILALSWMQWMDQTEPSSWYGITGIHGAPFADYGGVRALSGNGGNGYCTHVSNLFPPWHRPYLALYEQTIYSFIQAIASWYPDDRREVFQQAAEQFRIPYWDWAVKPPEGDSVLPLIVGGSPDIEVDGPNGIQTIGNPLFSYTFKPLNASAFVDYPFMFWNETKRRPIPFTGINATSNNSWVAKTMDTHLSNYQQRLYNLFASYGDYATWSNEAWIPDDNNGTYDSVESLHDTIHLDLGGDFGHMAIIAYSSFDPVFFLHHANVDRIFAMWQLVYNNSYVGSMPAVLATRTISVGDVQTSKTDLTPFFFNETKFWDSDQVRDHKVFGYSYAEVTSGNRSETIAAINRMYTDYSPATMFTQRKHSARILQDVRDGEIVGAHGVSGGAGFSGAKDLVWDRESPHPPPVELILKNGSYHEWVANIHVNKHALNASFQIYLFFGVIQEEPSAWEFAYNLVGNMGVFAGNYTIHANTSGQQISGTVPLTSALVGRVSSGDLRSLEPENVEPFLRQYLGFRIAADKGSAVQAENVEGLGISIISSLVKAPEHDVELAIWGEVVSHFDLY